MSKRTVDEIREAVESRLYPWHPWKDDCEVLLARVAELVNSIEKSFPKGQKIQLREGVSCEVTDVGEIVSAHASVHSIRVAIYGCNCTVADYGVGDFRMIDDAEYETLAASAAERLSFTWTKVGTFPARSSDESKEGGA